MRIAFMGKGGSGKTTTAASFALFLAQKQKNVLAIDGDVNLHMAPLFDAEQLWVHKHKKDIQKYLEKDLAEKGVPIIGTMPPTQNSQFIYLNDSDEFIKKYATRGIMNVPLLTVGTYESKDAGANCFHGKLQVLELMLHRIVDKKEDVVVCDMTAGIDALGTSLYMACDMNVFVVEPTLKSVQVYKDFAQAAQEHGVKTYAIANKIGDQDDRNFITEHISEDELLGFVEYSNLLRKIEQGDKEKIIDFVNEQEELFNHIYTKLTSIKRDWKSYHEELKRVYRLNCEWWYNGFHGVDLTQYIDNNFDYEKIFTA